MFILLLKDPVVIRNDTLQWPDLSKILTYFDNVVISPGPGVPFNVSGEPNFSIWI